MIITGFKIVPFFFHCVAGKGAQAANQQPGGFPLGMRIDGNDSFRIPAGEAILDLIQFQHTQTPFPVVSEPLLLRFYLDYTIS